MKIETNSRFECEPSKEPAILTYSVQVNTNIRKMTYTEGGVEKHYWLVDVVEYDKSEWYQKKLEDLKKDNTQLWDTVEYLLKQVDAGIPII